MSRQPRFLPPNNYYHIMNRGNNGQNIFISDDDYLYYLKKLAELKKEHPFELIHYCLMGTHIHLLVKILRETNFSIFSKRLNLSYANYFKRSYGLIGHFWQGRFKSQLISNDSYLIQCGKYIELNPIAADIIKRPEDYIWSSYNHYAFGKKDKIITDNIFYKELGQSDHERQENYQKLVISDEVVDKIDNDELVIGNARFSHNVKRKNKYHIKNHDSSYRQMRI